jgi:DNA polymerase-4
MEKLPVEKFFGVGKVTAEKMKKIEFAYGCRFKKTLSKPVSKTLW